MKNAEKVAAAARMGKLDLREEGLACSIRLWRIQRASVINIVEGESSSSNRNEDIELTMNSVHTLTNWRGGRVRNVAPTKFLRSISFCQACTLTRSHSFSIVLELNWKRLEKWASNFKFSLLKKNSIVFQEKRSKIVFDKTWQNDRIEKK